MRFPRTWQVGLALGASAAGLLALPELFPLETAAREREPNAVYAERRARLAKQVDGPVVLFGYTGKESISEVVRFEQEESFYYLTGLNEEGAALLIFPATSSAGNYSGPREILFLPPRDAKTERWNGPRIGPADPDVQARTGFTAVETFGSLRAELGKLSATFSTFYTLLPAPDAIGFPHARVWNEWLRQAAPQAKLDSVAEKIAAMRQIKSPGEIAFLTRAMEVSMDAHFEAMKMMRPGLFDYQVAAKMQFVHRSEGCLDEAYAPIVGAGFFSTVLHYDALDQKIKDGDIVVLDVACAQDGYAADITRTLPANGHFTARQREIYEIVLAAQNAALAAAKPGMTLRGDGPNSLHQIAADYINSHGKDREGQSLGRYFIHGLGHHLGLNVHDANVHGSPLEPGMVITLEPGIYIPEENLGVRIEDDVLITETGAKLLTARLPRTVAEIEALMEKARAERGAP
jgi:Xaa-Pro aminopeptidase